MEAIRVNLGSRSYDITIQSGGLDAIGEWAARFSLGDGMLLVADTNTAPLFGDAALASLTAAGFSPTLLTVPAGEASKSLAMADRIYEQAIRAGLDRNSAIVALGGGVVGDLAGFAAATYLRGVPFLQVPTTLLAQVDSSVGGKVAVDHALGKNLIGAFYQPRAVLIDPQTLLSLPEREFAAGMAEVIKYGLILDADFLTELRTDALAVLSRSPQHLERIIARCCRLKAQIVERDETDVGDRLLLNFGHTAGHAIELAGGFERFVHGEGVALGMLAATRLSELVGLIPMGTVAEVRSLLELFDLPVHCGGLRASELIRHMAKDKKRAAGSLRWVLLEQPGRAVVRSDVSIDSVREALQVILRVE